MRIPYLFVAVIMGLCLFWWPQPGLAQGRVTAARAAAEFLIEKFGPAAAREGVEVLTRRIASMVAKHGEEEVILAIRRVGPQFFKVVEEAGVNGGKAVSIMAQHGEAGIAFVLKRPKALSLVLREGEAAATVLVKHPGGVIEPLLEQCGQPAIKALQVVGPQGGRRLAIMMSEGQLAKIGRTPELLDVIGNWGEKGMDFVWKHKEALAISGVLAAFIANPEPFINGTRDITKIAAENAIKPIADIPGEVAKEAARKIDWTLIVLVCLVLGGVTFIVVVLPWVLKLVALRIGGLRGPGMSGGPSAEARPAIKIPESDHQPQSLPQPLRPRSAANKREGFMSLDLSLALVMAVLPLCLMSMAVVLPPVVEIITRKCHPDPNNQRKIYELDVLKASISTLGILQPIGVRFDAAKNCNFAMWGTSRLLCALDLGLETIPARVWERELSRLEIALFQAAENLARVDLRPSERAGSFRELMTLDNLTATAFAEKWSISAATVSRHLALLEQPRDIIDLVDQDLLPLSTVAALARLPDEESKRLMIVQIREGCLPRHKVEEAVQAVVGKRDSKPKPGRLSCKHGNVGISLTGDGLTSERAAEALQWLLKFVRKAAEQGQSLETLTKDLRKGV